MEEVELIRVAFQGTEMLLRTAGAGLKEALKFLKFLVTAGPNCYRWWNETAERAIKKKLAQAEYDIIKEKKEVIAGSMDLNKFMRVYDSEERTMLAIPDASAGLFADLAEKNNLTYALLPDLNLSDGMFQVMVPCSQADVYKAMLESMIKEERKNIKTRLAMLETELKQVEEQKVLTLSEKKEMEADKRNETEPEKYQELLDKLEELDLTKEQIETEIEETDKLYSSEITYEEYMKTNSFAFEHADLFSEMMDEGIEPQKISTLSEFLTPSKEKVAAGQMETFEKAISEVAKTVDTGKEVVITDAEHPENYIRGTAYTRERDNGDPFVCSTYEVYKDNIKQKCDEFKHGEFTHYSDGKAVNSSPEGEEHWENMKQEMREKTGLSDKVLVFDSMASYAAFKNPDEIKKGTEYFISPEPSLAVRRDRTSSGENRYVVLIDGEETKLGFAITKATTDGEKQTYINVINKEIEKINPDADLKQEWQHISGEEEYKTFMQLAKKKTLGKEELKEAFEQALGPEAGSVKETLQMQEEAPKNILVLPEDSMLLRENEPDVYYVYSKNMEYEIKVPKEQVKADSSGNRIILLREGEPLTAASRNKNRTYPIANQKDMEDFRKNTGVFAEAGEQRDKQGYTKSKNQFNNFNQRNYDYAKLEAELLQEQIQR